MCLNCYSWLATFIVRLAAHCYGEQRPSMECTLERDDLVFVLAVSIPSTTPRQLERGLVSLSP